MREMPMDRWPLLIAAVGLGLWLVYAVWRLRTETLRARGARAGYLDALRPLLDAPLLRLEPSGFPRLAGRYRGRAVDLQAVPDALAFRKLPALWLLATLTEPQPLEGETRILMRPSGLEPFSTFADLPEETAPPPGCPEGAVLRTTARTHLPPASVLAKLAPLFADPKLKEVVFSPKGLRLVRLAEEAPRGGYLLFREADIARRPVDPALVQPMLAALIALAQDLADATDRHPSGRRHG